MRFLQNAASSSRIVSQDGPRKLTIWAVSDGRAGIENQVLGLAEAVARLVPADIIVKRLHYAPLFDRWPTALKLCPDAMLSADSDRIAPPWPDIWIGAGRATLPHAVRLRQRSGGKTMVVQLQDPKSSLAAFDLVIAPEHDQVHGDNVMPLIGSTHRTTPERLAAEYAPWQARLDPLPHPRVTVLIGGKSKSHDLSSQRARILADQIRQAVGHGSLLLTLSRRTPSAAQAIFRDVLGDLPGLIFDGQAGTPDSNPYFAFLHAADHILVTEDSVNMAVEAAATGKPVYRLPMDRLRPVGKFAQFDDALRARGIARPFVGVLDTWTYPPLDETARAAQKVVDLFTKRT